MKKIADKFRGVWLPDFSADPVNTIILSNNRIHIYSGENVTVRQAYTEQNKLFFLTSNDELKECGVFETPNIMKYFDISYFRKQIQH